MGAILCSHFIVGGITGGLIGCTVDFGCRLVSLENYIAEEAFSARILQHSQVRLVVTIVMRFLLFSMMYKK